MGCAVVDRDTSGESDAAVHGLLRSQCSVVVLKILTNVSKLSSRLDDSLCQSSDLSLDFGCLSQTLNFLFHQLFFCLQLLWFDPWNCVLLNFVFWVSRELVVRELELYWVLPALNYSESFVGLGSSIELFRRYVGDEWKIGRYFLSGCGFLLFLVVFLFLFLFLFRCLGVSIACFILWIASFIFLVFRFSFLLFFRFFCLCLLLFFRSQFLLVFFSDFHVGIYCWFCCKNVIIIFVLIYFENLPKLSLLLNCIEIKIAFNETSHGIFLVNLSKYQCSLWVVPITI